MRSEVKIDASCHAPDCGNEQTNKQRKPVQFGETLLNSNGTETEQIESLRKLSKPTHALHTPTYTNEQSAPNKKRNRCCGKTSSRVSSKTRPIEAITWRRLGRLCWRRRRAGSPWWRGTSACWRRSCSSSSSWCSSRETTGCAQSNNPIRPLPSHRGRPLRLNRRRRQRWRRPPSSTVTVPSTTVKQLSTKTR